ncbi:hypothetical protein IFR05_001110 [Cadophora sp. M221]|nr:hypothetical protein IFR05_001110 [Cadophora sp. M221]
MASQIEELMPLVVGKGISMRLFVDHSKPEDSPEHNWVDTAYDGKDDSDILTIPSHWHREHDEIMEVLEGTMIFYLDGKKIIASAGDAPILIPRLHVHGFTLKTQKAGEQVRSTLSNPPKCIKKNELRYATGEGNTAQWSKALLIRHMIGVASA